MITRPPTMKPCDQASSVTLLGSNGFDASVGAGLPIFEI